MTQEIPRRLKRFERKKELEKLKAHLKKFTGTKKAYAGKADSKERIVEEILTQIESRTGIPKELHKRVIEKRKKELIPHAIRELKTFRERHQRFPEGKELDEIAENLFRQIETGKISVPEISGEEKKGKGEERTEKRHGRFRGQKEETGRIPTEKGLEEKKTEKRHGRRGQKQESSGFGEREAAGLESREEFEKDSTADFKDLSVTDLFASEGKKKEKKMDLGNLNEHLPEGEIGELSDLKDIDNLTKEIETEKNLCPNCSNKAEHLIFCPECGAGFCSHCALQAKDAGDSIKYTCPKCKKEVKVKK